MTDPSGGSNESSTSEANLESLRGEVWPVYSGKSFNVWNPDTNIYFDSAEAFHIAKHLYEKRLRQCKSSSSAFSKLDPAVICDPSTLPCLRPRIVFRDVTNPTNTRTMVASLIPGNRVTTHKAPHLLKVAGTAIDEAFMLGVLSSMPFDWQARRTVELNMTFAQLNAFTIPDPGPCDPIRDRVAQIAGQLAATDGRFADWAEEVGVPVASVRGPLETGDLLAELDACVAYLYGLDENDMEAIYSTFSESVDYSGRQEAVLNHYRRIRRRQDS